MGAVIYGLIFFVLFPKYLCLVEGTINEYEDCYRDDICENDQVVTNYKLNYTSPYTLNNWVEQMDLTCVSNKKIAWIGSSFLIAQSVSYLMTPFLIRAINIKNAWLLLALIQFITYLTYYFVNDINVALVISIFYGISGSRCAFSYTYLA